MERRRFLRGMGGAAGLVLLGAESACSNDPATQIETRERATKEIDDMWASLNAFTEEQIAVSPRKYVREEANLSEVSLPRRDGSQITLRTSVSGNKRISLLRIVREDLVYLLKITKPGDKNAAVGEIHEQRGGNWRQVHDDPRRENYSYTLTTGNVNTEETKHRRAKVEDISRARDNFETVKDMFKRGQPFTKQLPLK